MNLLERLASEGPQWSLAELVDLANPLLPKVLPADIRGKTSEGVNTRLVRYYTSLKLMDEPGKDGREARYSGRHLMQLLVTKRLLAEGISTALIGDKLRESSTQQLLAMLLQGFEVTPLADQPNRSLVDRNAALEYAMRLKAEQQNNEISRLGITASSRYTPSIRAKKLLAIEVRPGLSLLIEEGFRKPKTPSEIEALLKDIEDALKSYNPFASKPKP